VDAIFHHPLHFHSDRELQHSFMSKLLQDYGQGGGFSGAILIPDRQAGPWVSRCGQVAHDAQLTGCAFLGGSRWHHDSDEASYSGAQLCQRQMFRFDNADTFYSNAFTGECWIFRCFDVPRLQANLHPKLLVNQTASGFTKNRLPVYNVYSKFCEQGQNMEKSAKVEDSWVKKLRWQFLEEGGSESCIHDADAEYEGLVEKKDPKIGCGLLAVFPAEMQLMRDHSVVTAPYCDDFVFIVANSSITAPTLFDQRVVNLAAGDVFRKIPDDVWADKNDSGEKSLPNTVEKYHVALIALLRSMGQLDFWCLIESDTYFIPENFKRYLHLQNLNLSEPLFLGAMWTHSLIQDGILIEPSQGTCVNRQALERVVEVLLQGTNGSKEEVENTWPPTLPCEPFVKNKHVEVMQIANACFRRAGVHPVKLEKTRDAIGRFYYGNALDEAAELKPGESTGFEQMFVGFFLYRGKCIEATLCTRRKTFVRQMLCMASTTNGSPATTTYG